MFCFILMWYCCLLADVCVLIQFSFDLFVRFSLVCVYGLFVCLFYFLFVGCGCVYFPVLLFPCLIDCCLFAVFAFFVAFKKCLLLWCVFLVFILICLFVVCLWCCFMFDVVFLVFILIRLVVVCLWCCFMFDVVFVVFVWCVVLFVCLCYSSFVVVIDICLFLDCVFTLVLFVLCCRLLLFVFLFGGCDFSEGLRQWQTIKTHKKGFWFRGTPGNLEKPSKGKEHFDLFLFFGGGCFLVVVFCSFLLFFVFVSLSCFLFVFSTF